MQEALKVIRKIIGAPVRKPLGSLTHMVTNEAVAALTFDDGPHPSSTPRILELLKRHGARGTFFMVGEAAQRYPDLVRQVVEEGHAVGCHSWSHLPFPSLSTRERRRQIQACERVLPCGKERLFRPPYGEQTVSSKLAAYSLGYEVIGWNVEVGDWFESNGTHMADLLVEWLHPGAIVLLHDWLFDEGILPGGQPHSNGLQARCDRQPMLDALQLMLEKVGRQYRFLTIPELLQHGSPYRAFWFKNTLKS